MKIIVIFCCLFIFAGVMYAQNGKSKTNMIYIQCGVKSRYCSKPGWIYGPNQKTYLKCASNPHARLTQRVDSIEQNIY